MSQSRILYQCCHICTCLIFQVVAHLACVSEPSVCLADVVTDDQLEQMLRMCVIPSGTQAAHWGGPWASHSLVSLLQDLLQGMVNRMYLAKHVQNTRLSCTEVNWSSVRTHLGFHSIDYSLERMLIHCNLPSILLRFSSRFSCLLSDREAL